MRENVRLALNNIDVRQSEADVLVRYQVLISEILRLAIVDFYDQVLAGASVRYFQGIDIESLNALPLAHWRRLFAGQFDESFVNHATRIGIAHHERGISLQAYTQAYGWFVGRLIEALIDHPDVAADDRGRLAVAVPKFAFVDMSIAFAGYDATPLD